MGKPEYNRDEKEDVVQEEKRGTNDIRAEIRQQTKVSKNILKSLQKCCLKENLNVLTKFIYKKSNKEIMDHLRGMRTVLQVLLAQVPTPQRIEIKQSYMSFDDAFSLYLGYSTEKTTASLPILSWFRIRIHSFRFRFAVSYSEVEYETGKFKSDSLVF